jgi:predicted nucleotidyltransferase
VEEVLGAHTDPTCFETFLGHWETILAQRVAESVATFADIPGVCGLILAGSVGQGETWPLSDIDLLPIYDDDRAAKAQIEVERRRIEPLHRWAHEGWWTGIDIGNLVFRSDEVMQALDSDNAGVIERLQDNRWYHSLDKGYLGRPVYDPTGSAGRLAGWFTQQRFRPEVVALRLARERREVERAQQRLQTQMDNQDLLAATKALLAVVHWLRIWLMESWGERDNSFGRFGTRFEHAARAHGRQDVSDQINALSDLDDAAAEKRMATAPWWVWERHERQWRARQQTGEEVTSAQDIRDVLRVCTSYGISEVSVPPFPPWLGVPADPGALDLKLARLQALL